MPRADCEPIFSSTSPVCFASVDDSHEPSRQAEHTPLRIGSEEGFACNLPFNMPGVHDSRNSHAPPPLLPSISMPPRLDCNHSDASTRTDHRLERRHRKFLVPSLTVTHEVVINTR